MNKTPEKTDRLRKIKANSAIQISGLEHGKLQPQALDLEEAVLGAMMLEKEAVNTVIDILQPKSFSKESHQKIFAVIKELFNDFEPIDILTIINALKKKGELEVVGG